MTQVLRGRSGPGSAGSSSKMHVGIGYCRAGSEPPRTSPIDGRSLERGFKAKAKASNDRVSTEPQL